ncbi:MAG: FAD-dependent oxidoreductase, partial [Actinobacteria bacterium]|nr:FAD-dependent oxidoreductase [Actinomycetota bacterium]
QVEQIHWQQNTGVPPFDLVEGTDEARPADLVLLAMGFVGPETPVLDELGVARDARGNVQASRYLTSVDGIFAAGDARRGQSLIVWAINEGRQCATAVRAWLDAADAGSTLPTSLSIATGQRGE